MEDDLVRPLFTDGPIRGEDLIKIMQRARRIDVEDAQLANSIVSEAGTYLPDAFIDWLIQAKITDEMVRFEIKRQKAFFARLSQLLPGFIRYFRFNPRQDAMNAMLCLDDCHSDFCSQLNAQRQDRNRREILVSFAGGIRWQLCT